MIRNLLATTAIATLIATGGAMAQTTPPAGGGTMGGGGMATEPATPAVKQADGHLASNIIGESVYNGTGDDAENIGNVSDIVINADNSIEALVVGVGGFLGLGQKRVALEYDLFEWAERDGDEFLVIETTADALRAQQDFDPRAYEMSTDQDVSQVTPATREDLANAPAPDADGADDTAAAPTTTPPAGGTAMAPAPAPAPGGTAMAPATETPATEENAQQDMAQAPTTDDTETSAIDRSALTERPVDQISAEDFVGTTVYGSDEENVGSIGDVILSDAGQVDAVIVDVGGFLGIGTKPVAIGMENLSFMADEDGDLYLYTSFTRDQLDAQPEYDESTFAENRDTMIMRNQVQ